MKKTTFIYPPIIVTLVMLFLLLPDLKSQVTKVELFPYMVVNETGDGDATLMVDEQNLSGDPLNGDLTQPSTSWATSYSGTYPKAAYIDLGHEMELTHIFIFDLNGIGDLIVEYGEPGNWQNLFTDPLDKYKKWKQHDVSVTSRYLRISKTSANPKFCEIIVYADNAVQSQPFITDLAASNPTPQSVELTWTDAQPNTATGNLFAFDLRYSQSPITADNFDSCQQFQLSITPDAGKLEKVELTGLEANNTYFFALKELGELANTLISNIEQHTTTFYTNETEEIVFLEPFMITNESGLGDAGMMLDEQELSGDPLSGNGGEPLTTWKPSSNLSDYPASAYIDLGEEMPLSRIFFRDVNAIGDLIVESGSPGDWKYLFTEPCEKYLQWKQHDVAINTRYLRLTLTTSEAKCSEIILYRKSPLLVEEKIAINTSDISNPLGYGDAWKLVDEQEIAGDPANSPGGNPITYWQTGFESTIPYPLYSILDLGKIYEVTKVFIRDSYDVSDFTIWTGSDQSWELVATDGLNGFLSWNQHNISSNTRFLRFGKTSPRANVAEIVVYGIDHTPGLIDSVPPATITDLTCTPGNDQMNEVKLTWTSPGDDAMQGEITMYDIRFSTNTITAENFQNAYQWPINPESSAPGSPNEITITGLNPGTYYNFAVVAIDDNFNKSGISNVVNLTTDYEIGGAPFKIFLSPDMIINESVQGDAGLLADEQLEAGNPAYGSAGEPSTVWNPGSTDWFYPCYAIIDLGGNCLISDIFLYDVESSDKLSIFTGEPFSWNLAFVDSLKNTNTWNHHEMNQESRYLRIKLESELSKISEIVVYASRLEAIEEPPETLNHQKPVVDEMIGINAFINDPVGRMSVSGYVREYHNWMWCEGNNEQTYPGFPGNENKFNVMGWNFDYYYQNFDITGIVACPAIQNNVLWLNDFNYSKLETKPVSTEENPEDPFAYQEHADHLFQYAARYGGVVTDDGLLKLSPEQDRISGSGWLHYYEDWNEQDKWWKGRDAFFTPYEYAAMASADKDGHQGAMGNTFGVKNADPQAKLVMGGIAKPDLNYVKAMKLWADYNRDGDFPVDVINVHHYCNDGLTQSSGTVGVSPEEDDFKGLIKEFVKYRDRYLPGKEVWVTEFGYDTHPQSVQRAPEIGSYSQEEVQAQWLVRSYLALAAAGADKAAMYMLRDVDPNSSTKFNTSGLCASMSNNWSPKPSWYYVYTMKNRLAGMCFETEIESGNPNVWIYKFKNADNDASAYAVWCPTSSETYVQQYELSLGADDQQAMLVALTVGSTSGAETNLEIINGKVLVDVSEKPIFILAAPADYNFPEVKEVIKLSLNPAMVINESGEGDPSLMVDEQELSGDPYMGTSGEPVTLWSTSFGATYPVHAIIDLGTEQEISSVYLRDMNSTGNMTFSIGEPGSWTEVADENCGRYKVWSNHAINQNSRYVRVTKYAPTANFSEILIYVKN